MRKVIVLRDTVGMAQVELRLDLFTGQPVLRSRIVITNLTGTDAFMNAADMLPLQFSGSAAPFRAFRVNQWGVGAQTLDFQTTQVTLNADGTPLRAQSGAHGSQVSWVAVRDPSNHGIFGGWEFNGRSNAWVKQSTDMLAFSAPVDSLAPAAFAIAPSGSWKPPSPGPLPICSASPT